VFENRVLRRIFGPKRDEVMGEWRKTKELYSHNKSVVVESKHCPSIGINHVRLSK
jgi:hypothetical protein